MIIVKVVLYNNQKIQSYIDVQSVILQPIFIMHLILRICMFNYAGIKWYIQDLSHSSLERHSFYLSTHALRPTSLS